MLQTIARIILIAFIVIAVAVVVGHTLDPMAEYSLVWDYSQVDSRCPDSLPATPDWQTALQVCYPESVTATPEPTAEPMPADCFAIEYLPDDVVGFICGPQSRADAIARGVNWYWSLDRPTNTSPAYYLVHFMTQPTPTSSVCYQDFSELTDEPFATYCW
jgi:hypothetical protein